MKTIAATLCSLMLIFSTQAQDSTVIKTLTFYEENVLPAFRELLLLQKGKLLEMAGKPPKDINYNLTTANAYAGLLQFDSSLYYIKQELAKRPIDNDLYNYGFLLLMAKQPDVYKKFTDLVFFGRYNKDTAGRKRYLPSDVTMNFIKEHLLVAFYNFLAQRVKANHRQEWKSVAPSYNQLVIDLSKNGKYVYKGRLPQYSLDGVEITLSIVRGLFGTDREAERMVADRMSEIETLLVKKDIAWADYLCKLIDERLMELGKPQRYGTLVSITGKKAVLKTPHESLKEIEKRRRQVGLNTLQEYFRERIKDEEFMLNMPPPIPG